MQNFLIIIITLITINLSAQDIKNENKKESKIDSFVSKTGIVFKYIDYSLPGLKSNYGIADAKIRRIIRGGETKFFFLISKEEKYGTKVASIAYEDLLETIKALASLQKEVADDLALNPDYLENKFVTEDGFKLGYYISKGKLQWYMVLEKYGSENTIFFNDVADIAKAFAAAQSKIEELKK